MKKKKIYFPNLNGLRFMAAFLVIIHHIEQFKSIAKVENYWGKIPFINIIGKLGVILFFVLSGFLITYLLLAEEKAFKKISIAKFYMRRILRIWPLYFLIIILAFFVLPNIDIFILPGYGKDVIYTNLFWKLLLYAIFFPNLVLSLLGVVPYASHTWSIGTEEQYYLVWPVILKHIKKYRILLMFAIILFYLSFKFFLRTSFAHNIPYNNVLTAFWNSFPIDCMAIGALYAILLFQKNKFLKYLIRTDLFYFSIGIITLLMLNGVYIPYIHYEFYSVFFGLIILNFAVNDKIKISLENKVFNYLGNISYGLYMFHPIGIILALSIISYFNLKTNWVLYPLCFILTIIMAGLSYKYFESFFLQFKEKFSKVLSGNRKIE
ncbi:acyltransferase family protein [Polaribacter sp. L3A8]|uniref:acyltransferase family protein n=1 Tax=Polaribacter sp. L3A8 TaxID=2686361 RepID=UPI00131D175E|nr:acyltransferase [Polaribacter sp. L3A8]